MIVNEKHNPTAIVPKARIKNTGNRTLDFRLNFWEASVSVPSPPLCSYSGTQLVIKQCHRSSPHGCCLEVAVVAAARRP